MSYLTPKARAHWGTTEKDRARFNDRDCRCGLCELVPTLDESFRQAKREAWAEAHDKICGCKVHENPYASPHPYCDRVRGFCIHCGTSISAREVLYGPTPCEGKAV